MTKAAEAREEITQFVGYKAEPEAPVSLSVLAEYTVPKVLIYLYAGTDIE